MDKLRAMALLVATAQTGSFSQTGRKFGLSPARVSRQLYHTRTHMHTGKLNTRSLPSQTPT